MKKSDTILMAFVLFLNFNAFSQGPWTFTNDNSIWASTGTAANLTTDTSYSVLDVNGAGNPQLVTTTAGVIAASYNYAVIKIQNNTSNTRMRLIYNTSGTNRFSDTEISANDSEIKTYYVKCDGNADWTGTVNNITIQFKLDSDNNLAVDDGLGNFYIDDITMSAEPIERLDYSFENVNFNDDFVGGNGAVMSQTLSGTLKLSIDNTNDFPSLTQNGLFSIDGTVNNEMQMTIINDSPKDRITFVSQDGGVGYKSVNITPNSATPQVLYFDLEGLTGWSGTETTWKLQFKEVTGGIKGSAGTIYIQQILFHSGTLGLRDAAIKDASSISLYPNPVSDILSVNSSEPIDNITVYNILGEEQSVKFYNTNSLDVSVLRNGVYTIKVENKDHSVSIKRFVKKQ